MKSFYILLVTVAALAGCATSASSLPQTTTFVVIGMLGNTLRLKQIGITAFGNDDKFADVSSWDIDSHCQQAAAQALASSGRLVRVAPTDAAREIGSWTFTNFTSTYHFEGGSAALRNVASKANADYLVLLTPLTRNFNDPFFGTNQSTAGYGVYQRRGRGGVDFADLGILLVDGKSGEVIKRERSFSSVPRPEALWVDIEHAQPTTSDLAQPPEKFLEVIDKAVGQGLEGLGLIAK